jgi:hypothetical protein
MKTLKFGFDIHGVIDTNPEFFVSFADLLVTNGHEVHVISGPPKSAILAELLKLDMSFTHIFSITDHCIASGINVKYDDKGNPWVEPYSWDKAKGEYCQREGIHLHLDDSDSYGYFFKTPFSRYYSKDTSRITKIHL